MLGVALAQLAEHPAHRRNSYRRQSGFNERDVPLQVGRDDPLKQLVELSLAGPVEGVHHGLQRIRDVRAMRDAKFGAQRSHQAIALAPAIGEIYGASRMIIIYTFASIAGFALSSLAGEFLWWMPIYFLRGAQLTVGASAAIFGLLGAAVYYGRRSGSSHASTLGL